VSPLLYGAGKLVTADIQKDKVLDAFFASVFTSKSCFQEPQTPETRGKIWSKEDLLTLSEEGPG